MDFKNHFKNYIILLNQIYLRQTLRFELAFHNSAFKLPVCPIVFRNSRIHQLTLSGMANSFYKTNMIRFSNETPGAQPLNASIKKFMVFNSFGLVLSRELMDERVFERTSELVFDGVLSSIHVEFFGAFRI